MTMKGTISSALLQSPVCTVASFLLTVPAAQQRQVLQARLSAPAGARAVGRLPDRQRMDVALTLRLRNYDAEFHDITVGDSFNSGSPNLFSDVVGYDLVTGWGSPNGQSLLTFLGPLPTGPNFAMTASPPTLNLTPGRVWNQHDHSFAGEWIRRHGFAQSDCPRAAGRGRGYAQPDVGEWIRNIKTDSLHHG